MSSWRVGGLDIKYTVCDNCHKLKKKKEISHAQERYWELTLKAAAQLA